MSGEIKDTDYGHGRTFTVVRDIHGTRVGMRNIPRGHRVVTVVMVTAHEHTAELATFAAGEDVSLDQAASDAALKAITGVLATSFGFHATVEIVKGSCDHHHRFEGN